MLAHKPTVCFIGTRLESFKAVCRFSDVHSIVTKKDSWVEQYCLTNNIKHQLISKETKHAQFEWIANQKVDIIFSAGFPFILPASVLNAGPLFVNAHPSLLPAYIGNTAIRAAFANKEEYMGVTVHYMVEKVDTGEIISQEKVWVKSLDLPDIYELLFSVVEPMAISRAFPVLLKTRV